MPLPLRPAVLRGLLKELRAGDGDRRPLVVGGARELAAVLRRELGVAGGDAPEGAAVLAYVLGADDDEAALRRARRARVPIVAVAPEEVDAVPYVLATDVVHVPPGRGFPVEEIAKALAARLGEDAAPLAARVPALRRAVAERLVASFARKNAALAAAVFVARAGSAGGEAAGARPRRPAAFGRPGADLPLLALNQLRLVLRLEQAYGLAIDPRERAPEIAATLGAGVGLRALAREALDLVPGPGWMLKGAVAYAGTRALGEATLRRLDAATRPPAAGARGGR